VTAARPATHTRDVRPTIPRGPAVAGVEISSGVVHVVVGHKEESRLRVTGRGESALPESAVSGGLVQDRASVADALRTAFTVAEQTGRADRVAVAVDSDDMRTFHAVTAFEREDLRSAMGASEETRALREAAANAAARASAATEEDAGLRGVATAQLRDDVAALALDGRALRSLVGHRGRLVEVWTDVTLGSLVVTGAATAALEAARRRGAVLSGAYVLGRLVAGSGITDAGVVRLAADLTAVAVVREGRVVETRVFALGRSALAARAGQTDDDARVWADCVVAALRGLDGPPPGHWLFVGVPESLLALPSALGAVIGEIRGDRVDVAPLSVAAASRLIGEVPLRSDDLVAAGAAALAAGVYDA
jgi:hypothetical protein